MTNDIRKAVKIELIKKDVSQVDIAEKIGVTPQHLSRMLSESSKSKSGDLPEAWEKLLNELGLELVVKAKSE